MLPQPAAGIGESRDLSPIPTSSYPAPFPTQRAALAYLGHCEQRPPPEACRCECADGTETVS